MHLPQSLINSLQKIESFKEIQFKETHQHKKSITSVRMHPVKKVNHFLNQEKVPWSLLGCYLKERPSFTFDPFFHAGCYYVQEASSMFVEQALIQSVDITQPLKVLDLCAAPGGKSTHLQSLISADSLLVSNEVIKSRAHILKDNIIKWGSYNVMVTNNDPKEFKKVNQFFDVIVVDAPCSGSGLFRKDENAINEWSENNVMLCSQRQQRILADVLPALKENGILIYSTCSYSKAENEDIVDWLKQKFLLESISLKIDEDWKISEVKTDDKNIGYRFWPYNVQGEGFFLSVFKKINTFEVPETRKLKSKLKYCTKEEYQVLQKSIKTEDHEFMYFGTSIFAWPQKLVQDMHIVAENLTAIYSGVQIGEIKHDKLIPAHALAMSLLVKNNISLVELSFENSIKYLQRKDFIMNHSQKGWHLVAYQNKILGWVNLLGNRFNNYYPKELRILKDTI